MVRKQRDIIKIVHKHFRVKDVPMDELLQEVYLTIIHKNRGKSAHDPRKSSFGHYVWMVANNVCINIVHRRKRHANERDSLDAPCGPGSEKALIDTLEAEPEEIPDPVADLMQECEAVLRRDGHWEEARYLRAVQTGVSAAAIREALSFGDHKVTTKAVREMRLRIKEKARDAGLEWAR